MPLFTRGVIADCPTLHSFVVLTTSAVDLSTISA